MFEPGALVCIAGKQYTLQSTSDDGNMVLVDSDGGTYLLGREVLASLTDGTIISRRFSTQSDSQLYIEQGGHVQGPYMALNHDGHAVSTVVEYVR